MQPLKDELDYYEDAFFAERKNREIKEHKLHVAITTIATPAAVYEVFRNFQNFPLFVKEVISVEQVRNTQSRWNVSLNSGEAVHWDVEIVRDVPEKMILWASDQAQGEVRFMPAAGGRGTVIEVLLDYEISGGKFAELINKFFGESPHDIVRKNLHRIKAYIETGEVPTTEGQPSGREDTSTTIQTH